jgi:hypothetical protein
VGPAGAIGGSVLTGEWQNPTVIDSRSKYSHSLCRFALPGPRAGRGAGRGVSPILAVTPRANINPITFLKGDRIMNVKRVRPALVRTAVVLTLVVGASVGLAASPASAARNETCRMYAKTFKLAQDGFMEAYDSYNQGAMDFWLKVYEDAIDGAESAGC